jgi:NAD(P)-dependent dehydrogenase (short-subunit alcohol dehydrogenase family)
MTRRQDVAETEWEPAEAVGRQRAVQEEVGRDDQAEGDKETSAAQFGARPYPAPPFPAQHQPKPGKEQTLDPAPMYDAPFWKGSGKLAGKVALIAGGDSGLGRAVAVLFAREGADVAIAHLAEEADAAETRAAIEAEGCCALVLRGDVGERDFCREAVARTVAEFGGIAVLVNNAAFQAHTENFLDLSPEHFDETLRTNLRGYFHMAQAAEVMKPGSAIVHTGSVTGIEGSKDLVDYSMTKSGIQTFTRALSGNLLPRGIRVNCVAPGSVWTPLNLSDKQPEKVAHFGEKTPMKRPTQPEEIAPAYVFLGSPQCSSYITGEILAIVDGY